MYATWIWPPQWWTRTLLWRHMFLSHIKGYRWSGGTELFLSSYGRYLCVITEIKKNNCAVVTIRFLLNVSRRYKICYFKFDIYTIRICNTCRRWSNDISNIFKTFNFQFNKYVESCVLTISHLQVTFIPKS